MKRNMQVLNVDINIKFGKKEDYISLTDIAKFKNPEHPADVVKNWTRSKETIEFLGLWEKINNKEFKLVKFDQFRNQAGTNAFILSPKKWIEETNAIGLFSSSGRYGGTFAHKDIAFEFAAWISSEFRLYLIKEFQRLKVKESKEHNLEWNFRRELVKTNYKIHTDAIKKHLIPVTITRNEESLVYATEADILNLALFGMTAKEWRESNSKLEGNIRDYAETSQLICLSNLENLNAHFIKEGISKAIRLEKLNETAIEQMTILTKQDLKKLE